MTNSNSKRYLVEAVSRACDILAAFGCEGDAMRFSDLVEQTGLSKATVFRLLYTLEHRGLIEQSDNRFYRLTYRPRKRRRYRLGYGAQSSEFSFSRTLAEGLEQAARDEGVDLLTLNNRYSPAAALRNAELFVREQVDLVIEFQTDEHCAPAISTLLHDAKIPLIAVEIPHPGATYYGADNYRAGLIAGRHLAKWTVQHWSGNVDQIILLELSKAGTHPHSRLTGTLAAVREALPHIRDCQVTSLDGNGQFEHSLEAVRKYLRRNPYRHVLVGAVNDPSAIGAARAFAETGRSECCAVVGQNASAEAREEMRQPGTRLIGSVGYFPERYGNALVQLAIDILQKKSTPPAVFVKHQLVTPQNVNQLYPIEREKHLS